MIWRRAFTVLWLVVAAIPALAEADHPGLWVASRYDDSRVLFLFATVQQEGYPDRKAPELPQATAKYAQGGVLSEASAAEIDRLRLNHPRKIQAGGRLTLSPGSSAAMAVTVEKLVILVTCSDWQAGAIATVAAEDAARFRGLPAKYYLVQAPGSASIQFRASSLPKPVKLGGAEKNPDRELAQQSDARSSCEDRVRRGGTQGPEDDSRVAGPRQGPESGRGCLDV